MRKVLFFIESLSGGGAEKVLSDIVTNINKNEFDITVCTVVDQGIYQEDVMQSCCYYSFLHKSDYNNGGFRKLFYWLKTKLIYGLPVKWIYRFFIKDKYDTEIAFVEGYATKFIGASNNKYSKKIAWVHTDMIQNNYADNYYKNLTEHVSTYRRFDRIICVSQSVKKSFQEKFFSYPNIYVQYNPVDKFEIIKKSNENINLTKHNNGVLLGSIGRLEKQKGYSRIIECAKKLHEKGYVFSIWIVGDGSEKTRLENEIKMADLTSVVKLLGFQNNPYKYIAKCDAFICSSLSEGYSTAATESLILGKPIFTVDCPGMKELFGNYRCGEIVDNNDEAFFSLIECVVSKKIDVNSYKLNILKRQKMFDMSARISEIEELLK